MRLKARRAPAKWVVVDAQDQPLLRDGVGSVVEFAAPEQATAAANAADLRAPWRIRSTSD